MSKILLTGMTSAHVSQSNNDKNKSFMGVIADVLTSVGHEVAWHKASPLETADVYEEYDSVVVGVTPLGSLAANYAYGGLNVIERLWSSSKLTLLIDAPNASQIEPNLKMLQSNSESLVKSFFSARSGYKQLAESPADVERLHSVVRRLFSEEWPPTIFPRLPWRLATDVKLPPNAKSKLYGINLDSHLIGVANAEIPSEKSKKWVIDNSKTKWAKAIVKTLGLPVMDMKPTKSANDSEVYAQIARSTAVLLSPDQREGTWWSYRIVQALTAQTPIATDWQESCALGESWDILASSIESMSAQQRYLLSLAQLDVYTANIDSKTTATQKLETILRIGTK